MHLVSRQLAVAILLAGAIAHTRAADFNEIKAEAERGDPASEYILSLEYQEGGHVPKDLDQSVQWLAKAASQGFVPAQFRLGTFLETGVGGPVNTTNALAWYLKAAGQGFAPAQLNLGRMYSQGEGAPASRSEAFKWFIKAAKQGIAAAQYEVANAYDRGNGVLQNWGVAVAWYQKAALQNYGPAQDKLGVLYAQGHGVKADPMEAYHWLTLAARQGIEEAQPHRHLLIGELDPGQMREATLRADTFIPLEPPDPFDGFPSIYTQAADDAINFLIDHRSPIRLSTLNNTAADQYEFSVRIYGTNESGGQTVPLDIQMRAFANHSGSAILFQSAAGVPYAYATQGYFVSCDPADPGHLIYYKGNGLLFRFDSEGWDFGLQLGLPDPPDPDDDIDFNLARVLKDAGKQMDSVRYDKDTRTIKISIGKKNRLFVTTVPDTEPGPFGLEKVVLKREGQTIVFTKFVIGKISTQMIPDVSWHRIEALDLPMRQIAPGELATISFQPPAGFPRNGKERAAVEKLRSVLW